MSKIQRLIEKAYAGKSVQEKAYGEFPLEIATELGAEDIAEIITGLDHFEREKQQLDDADGDGQDEYWRLQLNYSKLLQKLTSRYPHEIVAGLQSCCPQTAFWVCHAFANSPSAEVIPMLREYLQGDIPATNRAIAEQALKSCKAKSGLFGSFMRLLKFK